MWFGSNKTLNEQERHIWLDTIDNDFQLMGVHFNR